MNQDVGYDEIKPTKAPWHLRGDAYVAILKMPEALLEDSCFVPEGLKDRRIKGNSTLMVVDYQESPVGPYRELLFMPGKYRAGSQTFTTISRIFVSTPESVVNGFANWRIPKTLADFSQRTLAQGKEQVSVSLGGRIFASLEFETSRLGIPFTDGFVPSRFRTMGQFDQGRTYLYAPVTRASLRPSRMTCHFVDPGLFPDVSRGKVLRCLCLKHFRMDIPPARLFEG